MRASFLPGSKREPLFSLQEIADKFGCPMMSLRTLLSHHPEGRPQARCKSQAAAAGLGAVGMYPLSEFRAWLAKNKIDLRRYPCK